MKTDLYETKEFSDSDIGNELIVKSLAKLDSLALGISVGVYCALVIFIVTNIFIFKDDETHGRVLSILNQYLIGYEVTFGGSLIGFLYGFSLGFIFGWLAAFLRNTFVSIYLVLLKLKNRLSAINDYIDNP